MRTEFSSKAFDDMIARLNDHLQAATPNVDAFDRKTQVQDVDVSIYYNFGAALARMLSMSPSWQDFDIVMDLLTTWAEEGEQLGLPAPAIAIYGDQDE